MATWRSGGSQVSYEIVSFFIHLQVWSHTDPDTILYSHGETCIDVHRYCVIEQVTPPSSSARAGGCVCLIGCVVRSMSIS